MDLILKTKSNSVDETGIVTIAVNAIGNLDSSKDISETGSFNKTLNENFKRVRHYLNHKRDRLIGCPLSGEEVNRLLVMKSQLNLDTEDGRNVYSFYKLYQKNNMTLEHSIGAQDILRDPKDSRRVKEWKLWEFSTLYDWGANEITPLIDLKSQNPNLSYKTAIDFLGQALREKFSDNILISLEGNLKLIEKAMNNKESKLVTCPDCGLMFDYHTVKEYTMQDQVIETLRSELNWQTYKIAQGEVEKLTPEIQSQIQSLVNDAINMKAKSIEDLLSYVHCPKCYKRIYRNTEDEPSKEEPSEDTLIEKSRQPGTFSSKTLEGLFEVKSN